jgi:hypothetical protein
VKISIEIPIEFFYGKIGRWSSIKFLLGILQRGQWSSIEPLWRIPMELHRNSMELYMSIFYGEILWRFLWNFL